MKTPSCRWTPLGPIGLLTNPEKPGYMVMSGRVTSIAVHPSDASTVYVGTAGGGLWKTVDRGSTWKPLFDRGPSLAIGAVAIDPAHPDRIFAGTGEGNDVSAMAFTGVGLLLSEDAGATWRTIAVPAPRATRIVVSPTGDRVLLASNAGLFEWRLSGDAGRTFAPAKWDLLTGQWVYDVVFDDLADRVYAAIRGGELHARSGTAALAPLGRSGPAGKQLPDSTTLSAASRVALAWIRSDHHTVFAAFTDTAGGGHHLLGIFRSDQSGPDEWTAVVPPLADPTKPDPGSLFEEDQGEYNFVLGRNPSQPAHLFLGMKSLRRSVDLGGSFEPPPPPVSKKDDDDEEEPEHTDADAIEGLHADQHALAFGPGNDDVWLGNDGGVWLSTDRGDTWNHRNRGLAAMQLYGGAHHAEVASLLLAGSQDNASQFRNGHPLWQSSAGGDVADVAIDPVNRRAWIATNHAIVQMSERLDQRERAFTSLNGQELGGPFFSRIALAPSDPNRVYRGAGNDFFGGTVGRADADLEPWWFDVPELTASGARAIVALAVAWDDPRLLYAADSAGNVFKIEYGSLNSAVTQLPEIVGGGTIEDIAVSPRDSSRLYVVIGEDTSAGTRMARPRLFRFDAGTHWADLSAGLAPIVVDGSPIDPRTNAVHAITIDPDPSVTDAAQERVYIGCDRGVFESLDGGTSWRAIDHGLPLTPVYDLRFHQGNRLLRAFTHGRGAWERSADVDPCAGPPASAEISLRLRDVIYDDGGATAAETTDPVRRDGRRVLAKKEKRVSLHWTDAPDLKVDREALEGEKAPGDDETDLPKGFQPPASTVDYSPDGALDCIGFEALLHRDPRRGAKARVHLQVHNDGPDPAAAVTVRVFFVPANEDETWPDLPADFWTAFPGDPAPGSPWHPLGPAKTIASIRPAEPEVVTWEWDVPRDTGDILGLLAIVTSADDAVFDGVAPAAMPRAVAPLVANNRRVSFKKTDVIAAAHAGFWHKVLKGLEYAGIGVAAGAAIYGLYEGGKYVKKKL